MNVVRGLLLITVCCLGQFILAILIEGLAVSEQELTSDRSIDNPLLGESAEDKTMKRFHRIVFTQYADIQMSEHDKYKQAMVTRLHWVAWKYLNDTSEVVSWLDHNTLLGWYREGRILPWDWTVTVGVREGDFIKLFENRNYLKKHKCVFRNSTLNNRSVGSIKCSWMQVPDSGVFLTGYSSIGENFTTIIKQGGCTKGIHNLSEPCKSCPINRSWYLPLNCSSGNSLFSLQTCIPRRTGRILLRYYGSIYKGAECKNQCCVGGKETPLAHPLLSEQLFTPKPNEYDPDKDPDND